MEKYSLDKDIKVFYVTATSFPEGIPAAFQQLHSLLPTTNGREFFGISYPNPKGEIIYKAAAAESFPGEGEKYGCETFLIKKGDFMSERLKDWRTDEMMVGQTFQKLLSHPDLNRNGYCLEMFLNNDKDMLCLVPLV
ncbi:hypothetical protein CLV51_10655 [Chitinophaga niastensis]|uniref:Uncharacterized protein n=1 Tax=Chitinophaga niastensis TaxID=536980 RepID=A0A2P8HD95_CHINA|nr:transcriptional regulator [Chitinophaga niastensis]PSL44190.1 hypothetical protein CLV51_10655 [Chitinophaga niastensis]